MFSYKKGNTLKDILCPAEPHAPKRMERIFKSTPSAVVQHPTKGNSIPLKHYATCYTEGEVYMLKCLCGKVYVGQTGRQIKATIKEHRGDIKNLK
ncbi:hypothetical protein XELAEV_18013424mg [Xenopus laevis]|uniref:GIY-YIG domain-containing protein n=1 Tax=Xenopus laevis TaxID=8355 RepID=A0A974DPV4_XENLA|nr:hypothetical protein XELAEV_18013424mg [Xenopus laevis]